MQIFTELEVVYKFCIYVLVKGWKLEYYNMTFCINLSSSWRINVTYIENMLFMYIIYFCLINKFQRFQILILYLIFDILFYIKRASPSVRIFSGIIMSTYYNCVCWRFGNVTFIWYSCVLRLIFGNDTEK